jgi:hypothetical protein
MCEESGNPLTTKCMCGATKGIYGKWETWSGAVHEKYKAGLPGQYCYNGILTTEAPGNSLIFPNATNRAYSKLGLFLFSGLGGLGWSSLPQYPPPSQ